MVKYVIKRLLLAILILFGVSVILYTLVRLMPTNFIENQFYATAGSGNADPARLEQMLAYYGLEDDSFWGIIKGYFGWLGKFLTGDMGVSFKYQDKVQNVIFKNMGISFGISFVSLILQLVIAIPLGIKCAVNQYGKLDYTVTFFTMVGISFPTFFFANLLIKWLSVDLGWFPSGGLYSNISYLKDTSDWIRFWDQMWHLILPMFVLVILSVGSLVRYTRTNTLEVLNADYIRTARAKGLSENKVIYKHVFRNTLIPLVTTLAGTLPGLFGGAMITETVFDLPGIGSIAYAAMREGDIPFIMGYNMFIAILTVIGILLTDIMYSVVDPRVKLGK
ncbi:MAG: ABC transporter permease [Clostridia bacterium]|nr:ABC transporter permease [Clostridia bacterium]